VDRQGDGVVGFLGATQPVAGEEDEEVEGSGVSGR